MRRDIGGWAAVIGVVALLSCCGVGGLGFLVFGLGAPGLLLREDSDWRPNGVSIGDSQRVFALTATGSNFGPDGWLGQQAGFQDPIYKVWAHYPPGELEAFLQANHRTESSLACPIHELHPKEKGPPSRAVALLGFEDLMSADGGYLVLSRQGCLIEWTNGHKWVLLEAFGT